MKKQVLVFECSNEDVVTARLFVDGFTQKCCAVDVRALPPDMSDNFYYACCHLIDELAKMEYAWYEGKTVCVASPDASFTVGKIYEWKDGRVVDNDGDIRPIDRKIISLSDIKNKSLKFIELVD